MLTAADTMDDADLIQALRTGDREAARLLYDRYKDGLFTLARALLGDASAAEDVVHDVFVSFVESVENNGVRFKVYSVRYTLSNGEVVTVCEVEGTSEK